MPAPDTLNSLASDLNAMTPRARRQILGRLNAAERAAVERHLAEPGVTNSGEDAEIGPVDPVSPWLRRAIDDARVGKAGAMPPAARAALIESADAIDRPNAALTGPRPARETGRSLVEAFGGLLPKRQAR